MSPAQMTNGEQPASLFLSHLSTYPVVSDVIKTYKTNHYGAKSIDIAQIVYDKFAAPFLPWLRIPFSIVHPYLNKADRIADSGLSKVDEKFPVVKEETSTIKDTVLGYAFLPVRKAAEGKQYVTGTYNDEHRKVTGEGLPRTAKAIVSTELRLALEAFEYASGFFSKQSEKVSKQGEKISKKGENAKQNVKHKVDEEAKKRT